MANNESDNLKELKKKKNELNQEISKKEWQGFKNRFNQMSLFEKVIFIIGTFVVFLFFYFVGVSLSYIL